MGVISFNGVSSSTLGIEVVHPPHFHYAERNYSYFEIPGGNGSKLIDAGGRKNVEAEYELNFIVGSQYTNFEEHSAAIMAWLNSGSGYCRLEDSYNPNWYRMAAYSESNQIENVLDGGGKVTVRFNCKPQRWLKTGENPLAVTNGQIVSNSTINNAYPLLYIVNNDAATFSIGDNVILISKSTNDFHSVSIGDIAVYNNNSFLFDGTKWSSYVAPEDPGKYKVSFGDIASYIGVNYVYAGSTKSVSIGNIAIYDDDIFLFDGSKWVAYELTQSIGDHVSIAGEVISYNGTRFAFDGTKWVAEADYSGDKKFIGTTDTEIVVDSEVSVINLTNVYIGVSTTEITVDSVINSVVIGAWADPVNYQGTTKFVGTTVTFINIGSEATIISLSNRSVGTSITPITDNSNVDSIEIANYSAVAGDVVIHSGSELIFNGSTWVNTGSYIGNTRFIGQTSTAIAEGSTQTIIALEGLFIDCETCDAYLNDGKINRNRLISCEEFPFLSPGENVVSFTNLSMIELTPRWYV